VLHVAAANGHEHIVDLLLNHPDVDIEVADTVNILDTVLGTVVLTALYL
jgi:hypothetical protein